MSIERINFKVFRFEPGVDQSPYYSVYEIPYRDGMTVLEALFYVLERVDGSLAFRYSCREAICGSCAMYINGMHRLACKTQIKDLRTKEVAVGPLPRLQVVKDLVVDMAPFFAKYERIKPYLINNSAPPEKERLQSPAERKRINEMIDCILCGSCYSSCVSVWTHKDYLGPSALLKSYRFLADSRDEAAAERLDIVGNEQGVWRCHTIFNCAEVCPKNINQTWSIQQLKRAVCARAVRGG